MKKFILFATTMCLVVFYAPPAFASGGRIARLLTAIWRVESGGQRWPKRGDHGRALGPYQIHRRYWEDVQNKIGGVYEDCRGVRYSQRVIRAYWARYCPRALADNNFQVLARVHNGGPRGADNPATLSYWHRVQYQLRLIRMRLTGK